MLCGKFVAIMDADSPLLHVMDKYQFAAIWFAVQCVPYHEPGRVQPLSTRYTEYGIPVGAVTV